LSDQIVSITDKGQNTSVAPNTSRINDLGRRQTVNYFCYWAAVQCKQIGNFKPKDTYLNNFAEPLDFRSHIKDLTVVSILFNLSPILEGLEDQSIVGVYFLDRNSRSRDIDLKPLTETHDFCMDVLYTKGSKSYSIQNNFDKTLYLRQLTGGFVIRSEKLDRVNIVYSTGESISLLDLINRDLLYIISFNNADVRFSGRTLFKDSRLLKDIPLFLKSFETQNFLSSIKSEKGNFTTTSKGFTPASLFNSIESKLSADCSFLFCDDLGNEWADYIGFKENQFIRFYHAKYSNKQFSASAFQDVVSQALKNLGNFNFNQNLDAKKAKVNKMYSSTKIKRLRKGSTRTCIKELEATFNNPKTVKEVVLVVNFLSKSELDSQLKLLPKGKAKKETVQILWLLSSLFSECLQRGIIPRVITKP
jgi:hypothetical protein